MLKLDPHERFTIDDCLQSSVFETDRLRNRNSTPVPKSRRRQPLSDTDSGCADQSERRSSVFCDIKDTELSQHDDCYATITSQKKTDNAFQLNNESNYANGTTSESTFLYLKNSAVPDVSTRPVKHDTPFLTSTRERVGDTKESSCDSDSSKPGFDTLDKVDMSQNSSNIDRCLGEAASNKYLKKTITSKQPFSDLSNNKSSVYETSFLLGPNPADKSSQKDISIPSTNVKTQTANHASSSQQTRLLEHDKKNNKVA